MKKTLLTLLLSLLLQLGFAQRPEISFLSYSNDNIEIGKNIELKVTLINSGEIASDNDTHIKLTSDSEYVTIIDAEAICGPLAPNETQEVTFTVLINKLTPNNKYIHFGIESVLEGSSVDSYLYYDFEDGLQGWTTIDADGDGFNWIGSGERLGVGYGHDSFYCLFSQSYDNIADILYPDNYIVTPQKFELGIEPIFSFWACAQDLKYPEEHFGLAISTTGNTSADDFTTIKEWTLTAKSGRDQGTWYQYTVDLSEYKGQEVWMALRHFNCFDQYFIAVDDIELIGVMQPMKWNDEFSVKINNPQANIIVDAVSHEKLVAGKEMKVDVTFINNGEIAPSYQTKAILSTKDEFVTITQGEYILESLDCNEKTTKSFYFTTDASMPENHIVTFDINVSNSEKLDESIDFRFGFEKGFDSWTTINANNDDHTWYHTTEVEDHFVTMIPPHSGQGHLMSESFCNAMLLEITPNDYLVSPFMINVNEGTTFGFWAGMQDETVPGEHFGVAISTTGNTSADDFTTIAEWTLTNNNRKGNPWSYFSVDLSEYANQNIWIAIRHFKCYDIFILCIDDVSINNFSRHFNSRHTFSIQNSESLAESTDNISIFPNPVNDRLYIETLTQTLTIEIFDIYGRQQTTVNGQQTSSIDVTGLNAGVYFVKINTPNGTIVKRIIKE